MGKFFFDYFPIICFFIAYKLYGVFVATGVAIVAAGLQIGYSTLRHKTVEKLHLVTFALILVLGSLTLIFHNQRFIEWKPTVVYWLFSAVLLYTQYVGKKEVLMHKMLSDKIDLPKEKWGVLNLSWAIFFLLMGAVNLYVAYHYSLNTWVNFKLFGTLGATLVFSTLQVIYLYKHIKED